jgi:hypothetical protein
MSLLIISVVPDSNFKLHVFNFAFNPSIFVIRYLMHIKSYVL